MIWFVYSSIPILRQLGLKDGKLILKNSNSLSMVKVWLTLEVRQFINASIQDVSILYYIILYYMNIWINTNFFQKIV